MPDTWDDARDTVAPGPPTLDEYGLPELLAGRYRILDMVGEGGMGVVCRGFDLDLEETVAVKFLRADLSEDDSLRVRFRREVKLARRVTHPHVARVFEFGRDGALCFLTMEFVPGPSLQALLRDEAPLPPAQVHTLAVGLCRGLAAAHEAGVVHGDIKPGNILVAPGRGAVLTDFGIAQALADPRQADADSSGTPFYMAPEQARGEALGPQADVYAVGVVLFEALTGTSPFPEDDPIGLLAFKRRGDEPALARLAPRLPAGWTQLITACLRDDPHARPGDAATLLARLGELGPVSPAPDPAPLAAPALADAGPRWLEVHPDAALAPRHEWIVSDLIDHLSQTRGLRVRAAGSPDDPLGRVARVDVAADELADRLRVTVRVTTGERSEPLSVEQPRAGLHRLAAELAARIAACLDQRPAPARRDVLTAEVSELYVRARHAYHTLRLDRAIDLYTAALALAPDNPLLQVGRTVARIQARLTFSDVTPEEVVQLRAAAEDAVLQHGELGESHLARARVQSALGDVAGSARSLSEAIARAPSLVEAYVLLAESLLDIGRLPDAARRLDIALALDRDSSYARACRARQLAYEGRWDEFYAQAEASPELRFRGVMLPRLMLWHPRRDAFESLELALVGDGDGLPTSMWRGAHALVAFALGREDRRTLLARMDASFQPSSNLRRNAYLAQIFCELACLCGDLPRALAHLTAADRYQIIDRQWLEHCPLLGPIRGAPEFTAVREHVRLRADAVAEAIWG